jgi:hypothetical protein
VNLKSSAGAVKLQKGNENEKKLVVGEYQFSNCGKIRVCEK